MAIERVKMEAPAGRQPIVNPDTGCLTTYGLRLIEALFKRTGGYESGLYELFLALLGGDATIAEVAASGEENAVLVDGLRSTIGGGLMEALQQDNEVLRRELENVRTLSAGNTGESLQQEMSDLRQEIAQLFAQINGIRGEDTAYQIQVIAGDVGALATVATTGAYSDLSGLPSLAPVATSGAYADLTGAPSLAAVATSGAYADLTGKPTLGTAADDDTGTSGHVLGFLDGNNTHSGNEAFTKPPAVPASTVAGLPAAATYTNGIAIATDLLAPATGSIVVGGGAVRGAVISDGTNWLGI